MKIGILIFLINFSASGIHSLHAGSHFSTTTDISVQSLNSQPFEFQFNGITYRGILDLPPTQKPTSLVILVPGHGRTNVASGTWNSELRSHLNEAGIATFAYDKAGNGNSGGTFDANQTVQSSSDEVLAAITELRNKNIPGSERIGLWGISRAGWINPLVIEMDNSIAFWISVSGPNHLDNMQYLLETNWRILGKDESEIQALSSEWLHGFEIQRNGGSYTDYQNATPNLSNDEFIKIIRGGEYTEDKFTSYQQSLTENKREIDETTGLIIPVPGFPEILRSIDIPVLAIFGEKDSQVNWPLSIDLYNETLTDSDLQIVTLPDCNHNIQTCDTGGYTETYNQLLEKGLGQPCNGYYETIITWINEHGFGTM